MVFFLPLSIRPSIDVHFSSRLFVHLCGCKIFTTDLNAKKADTDTHTDDMHRDRCLAFSHRIEIQIGTKKEWKKCGAIAVVFIQMKCKRMRKN